MEQGQPANDDWDGGAAWEPHTPPTMCGVRLRAPKNTLRSPKMGPNFLAHALEKIITFFLFSKFDTKIIVAIFGIVSFVTEKW